MSDPKQPYERLTRSRFGLNGTGSLWLGGDHLLLVNTTFALERYRRWYFREIQAVVLQRKSTRLVWNSVLGVIAILLWAGAVACLIASGTATAQDDIILLSVAAAVAGLLGFALIAVAAWNTSMGPACKVFIQTPHGLDRISTPNRVPAAEALIARLQPILLAAQTKEGERKDTLREIASALDQPIS